MHLVTDVVNLCISKGDEVLCELEMDLRYNDKNKLVYASIEGRKIPLETALLLLDAKQP